MAKTTIAILKLTYTPVQKDTLRLAEAAEEQVIKGFLRTNRYIVLERAEIERLVGEIKLQETLSEQQVAELGKTIGAAQVVLARLSSVTTTPVLVKNEKTGQQEFRGYNSQIVIAFRVVDVVTSQLLAAGNITTSGSSEPNEGQNQTAIALSLTRSIKKLSGWVIQFIINNFPIVVDFVQVTKEKKGEAEMVEVLAGKAHGMVPRDRLDVTEETVREINGRKITSRRKLGEIRVETIDGDEISTCRVLSGGKEIKAAADNKLTLKAVFSGKNNALFNQRFSE